MIEDDLKAAFAKAAIEPAPGFEARTAAGVHARWRRRSQKLRNGLVVGLAAATAFVVVARAGMHRSVAPSLPAPTPKLQAGTPEVSIRDLRDEARAQKTKIHADIELAEIELRRELEKDSPDEKRVVAIIDKISGLEAQARKTEILAQLKIRALTPKEQRKKMETELVDPLQGLYAPSDPMLRAEDELRRATDARERDRAWKRDRERAEREYEKARAAQSFGTGAGVGKGVAKGEGTLTINSLPPARVLIDGREIGMTPLRAVALPAGMHTVKLIAGDRESTHSVVVEQGRETRLIKKLD